MERLRKLWNHISAQLSELGVSQRVAIGLCAALVVVSFLWLLQWSTSPPMVSLANRDFEFAELDAAEQVLRTNGIAFETRGMRLLVSSNDRHNAVRLLYAGDALPDGSLFDMEDVVTGGNPFQSPEARQYAQNYAKGNELAKIIATSPQITRAAVILNPVTKRRLGGFTDVPTASVTVTLMPGSIMDPEMVEAIAGQVAGAVAGLKPYNVSITDSRTMRSYSRPHPDDAAGFDVFSMVKRREAHFREKIVRQLADIPGLQVSVTVEVDTSKRITQNVKHDPPALKMEQTDSTDQSTRNQATEPGVSANLGQALTSGAPGQSSTTEKTITENFEPKLTRTETIEHMPFATKKVTAAVGIPRSFVVGVFHALHPEVRDEPKDDDPAFVIVRDDQVNRVKNSVELIVMANDPTDVEVDVYPDMDWTAEGGVWSRSPGGVAGVVQTAGAPDSVEMIRTYGPQVVLAGFALMSLLLMMRMVRKSSELVSAGKSDSLDRQTRVEMEEVMTVDHGPVGQAELSKSLLSGQELEPEALRFQELGAEVSKMVEKDPEGSAGLVRRWMNGNK